MKILNYLSYFTLLVAAGLVALSGYWLIFPYKPIEVKSMVVSTTQVESGGVLIYDVDYCKPAPIKASITRSFVNGIIFTTNTVFGDAPTGCHKNSVYIQVPQELTSGEYSLRVTWSYKVNPIREIAITRDSNRFTIVGSDIDRQAEQENN